jgi:hypothetical protein
LPTRWRCQGRVTVKSSGRRRQGLIVDLEGDAAALEQGELDALVAMPVETPVLRAAGIPESDRLDARQRPRREPAAGVMSADQGFETNEAPLLRGHEGGAGVGPVGPILVLVEGQQHDVQNLSVKPAERQARPGVLDGGRNHPPPPASL